MAKPKDWIAAGDVLSLRKKEAKRLKKAGLEQNMIAIRNALLGGEAPSIDLHGRTKKYSDPSEVVAHVSEVLSGLKKQK